MDGESQFSTKAPAPCESLPQTHLLTHEQLHPQSADSQTLTHGQRSPQDVISMISTLSDF